MAYFVCRSQSVPYKRNQPLFDMHACLGRFLSPCGSNTARACASRIGRQLSCDVVEIGCVYRHVGCDFQSCRGKRIEGDEIRYAMCFGILRKGASEGQTRLYHITRTYLDNITPCHLTLPFASHWIRHTCPSATPEVVPDLFLGH